MIAIENIRWSEEKNQILKQERGISFEDVLLALETDKALAIEAGAPNYPHQQVLVVAIREYAYMVPMVVSEEEVFLKTIIPSRRHTKRYLRSEQ